MGKKISRNDPCPCGSGKKYKLCCMDKALAESPDVLWSMLRGVNDRLANQLFQFAAEHYGEQALMDAWDEFAGYDDDKAYDPQSDQNLAFHPWFLFNWCPEDEEVGDDKNERLDIFSLPTIARTFLKSHLNSLSEMQKRYIELCCVNNFSFFEVLQSFPGKGMTLRDIFLESEINVIEKSGSQNVSKGDIFFAKAAQYDQIGMLFGCAPIIITPGYKPVIIDLRARMRSNKDKLTSFDLYEWDIEIRELYFQIYDQMHTPPTLVNTDGDPLLFHELEFRISSAQIAFDRLKSLALGHNEDELLQDATFKTDGSLEKVEFPWLKKGHSVKGLDNTVLGHITIHNQKLMISVNSQNRAHLIRDIVESRLGDQVIHQTTKTRTIDEIKLDKADHPEKSAEPEVSPGMRKAMNKAMKEFLANSWKNWIDEKVPLLDGKTPREAVKDKDGREKVIALLDDFERMEKRRPEGKGQPESIQWIRKQLGLE